MAQERSVVWSRSVIRGGLPGRERVQLYLDQREHGPYDAEEARLLALEAQAADQPVAELVEADVSLSTLRLAQRLAGEDVPARTPPCAADIRDGTAKAKAYSQAQAILEWRESGMTTREIAGLLGVGREAVQEVVRSFTDLAASGGDDEAEPTLLAEWLSGPDLLLSNDQQVEMIAEAVRKGWSYPQIDEARKLSKGYTASFVSRQRKRYEREGREFPVKPLSPSRLTDEQVLEMRERYARGGVTDLELAMQYGVPRNIVSHALNGRNYKHVGGPIRSCRNEGSARASREYMCGHGAESLAARNLKQERKAA